VVAAQQNADAVAAILEVASKRDDDVAGTLIVDKSDIGHLKFPSSSPLWWGSSAVTSVTARNSFRRAGARRLDPGTGPR
jgi:hypothetical protein